jgi:hypothetical protein
VSVSDLYIPRISLHISSSRIGRLIVEIYCINRSQTHECGNLDRDPDIPFLGIYVSKIRHFVFAVYHTCVCHHLLEIIRYSTTRGLLLYGCPFMLPPKSVILYPGTGALNFYNCNNLEMITFQLLVLSCLLPVTAYCWLIVFLDYGQLSAER